MAQKFASIDFNAPDVAVQVERASQSDLDELPFGVIKLDRQCRVIFFSKTEARLSGHNVPAGQNLFDYSRCPNREALRAKIKQAKENAPADLELAWVGDLNDPTREMRIRVQSAHDGGVWMFIERD
jgi:photoactive yellow protein